MPALSRQKTSASRASAALYDYKRASTRGSATSARSAPVKGSPRLAHPRSSSSSAPADLLPSLDERRASFFTASDDSDERGGRQEKAAAVYMHVECDRYMCGACGMS